MKKIISEQLREKREKELENALKEVYSKAYDGVKKDAENYVKTFKKRYEKEYQAYLAGKYTKTQFDNWVMAQIGRGRRWNHTKNKIARRIVNANKEASINANEQIYKSYADGKNVTAYTIAGYHDNVRFDIYNENAVMNVIKGRNHTEFRTMRVDPVRDYQWNYDKIQKALASGIIRGVDPYKMADMFLTVMQNNQAAAIRNARTAITSAQNAGRMDTYHEAESMGIKLKKQWLATYDDRTRSSHLEIDGETVGIDDKFSNDLMYPGDPDGDPSEVYNCRCTMITVDVELQKELKESTKLSDFTKWVRSEA